MVAWAARPEILAETSAPDAILTEPPTELSEIFGTHFADDPVAIRDDDAGSRVDMGGREVVVSSARAPPAAPTAPCAPAPAPWPPVAPGP